MIMASVSIASSRVLEPDYPEDHCADHEHRHDDWAGGGRQADCRHETVATNAKSSETLDLPELWQTD